MVSDRSRLAPGASLEAQLDAVIAQATAAAAAGADLFQVRERDLSAGLLLSLSERAVEAASGTMTRVLVNDRLDIAIAAGAHGVQLRSAGLPAAEVRRLAPPAFLTGVSTHDRPGAVAAEAGGADVVVFGTVFQTSSKAPDHRWAGADALAAVAGAVSVPVLAIGGIDARTIGAVAARCSGVAAIGWFATTDRRRMAEAVRAARAAFDTIEPVI